jgi:Arc/MetJ family transcription regulator
MWDSDSAHARNHPWVVQFEGRAFGADAGAPIGRGDHGVFNVYNWCMARTNIDIDDELVAEVMRRFGVATKKEAVDLALRRLVGVPVSREFLLRLEGVGWEGDLEDLRSERAPEF